MAPTAIELKVRILADGYMAEHPGVPRQEAKRRVRARATMMVWSEDMHAIWLRFARDVVSAFNRAMRKAS